MPPFSPFGVYLPASPFCLPASPAASIWWKNEEKGSRIIKTLVRITSLQPNLFGGDNTTLLFFLLKL
ncbi:hypothetical protein L2E82_36413 [Cichorium intybus]|uniref:Uncharacterized protein n=1 Tax=Cichorium intybus TaxID=13427 RepID=A0ACB9BRN1_CICIN|nr:hypothetical protein L2E82_36413 [Cichorium intybus]